jgi:hypothetical protein
VRDEPADKKEGIKERNLRVGGREWRLLVLTASKSRIDFFWEQKGGLRVG